MDDHLKNSQIWVRASQKAQEDRDLAYSVTTLRVAMKQLLAHLEEQAAAATQSGRTSSESASASQEETTRPSREQEIQEATRSISVAINSLRRLGVPSAELEDQTLPALMNKIYGPIASTPSTDPSIGRPAPADEGAMKMPNWDQQFWFDAGRSYEASLRGEAGESWEKVKSEMGLTPTGPCKEGSSEEFEDGAA